MVQRSFKSAVEGEGGIEVLFPAELTRPQLAGYLIDLAAELCSDCGEGAKLLKEERAALRAEAAVSALALAGELCGALNVDCAFGPAMNVGGEHEQRPTMPRAGNVVHVRDVGCTLCHAMPGDPCTDQRPGRTGHSMKSYHPQRSKDAGELLMQRGSAGVEASAR